MPSGLTLSRYLEAATSILANWARVTPLSRFMLPFSSPTMMPRALTVRRTGLSSSAARAGRADASSASASSSANSLFLIRLQLLLFIAKGVDGV